MSWQDARCTFLVIVDVNMLLFIPLKFFIHIFEYEMSAF